MAVFKRCGGGHIWTFLMPGLDQDHREGCLSLRSKLLFFFFFLLMYTFLKRTKTDAFTRHAFPPKPCYSLAISTFQFTSCSVPWLMESLPCLFGYQGMKYSYCTLFQAEVIWVQRKWYLGLDFHSRLQLLKSKKGGGYREAAIFWGGNLFLFTQTWSGCIAS